MQLKVFYNMEFIYCHLRGNVNSRNILIFSIIFHLSFIVFQTNKPSRPFGPWRLDLRQIFMGNSHMWWCQCNL